ncbi:Uncharacterised protein [Streptococcus salivarius]|nr:Uncharacterised protein [Streptococcus salivarius]VUW82242.1 Uncharacterised protein [Streptococcus thermophilus]
MGDDFKVSYYRSMPSVYLKQDIVIIHKAIKNKINNLELQYGILINLFVLGDLSNSIEVFLLRSKEQLSNDKVRKILKLVYLEELEISKKMNSFTDTRKEYTLSDLGISRFFQEESPIDLFKYLKKPYIPWVKYKLTIKRDFETTITFNKSECFGELSYIGYCYELSIIDSLEKYVFLRIFEKVCELPNGPLVELRKQGICYTSISKYHDGLGLLLVGVLSGYSSKKCKIVEKVLSKINIETSEYIWNYAKYKLKKEIIYSTQMYVEDYYMYPFWVYNQSISVENLLALVDSSSTNKFIDYLQDRKFICTKIKE